MSHIFENYKIALLDSSFFMAPFSQEVKNGLAQIKVYVADTFNAEIEQYKTILSPTKRAYYDANIDFLQHIAKMNTLNLASFGEEKANLHNDVWGLITLFKSINPNAKIVLVTANSLLIQRVILHEIRVDIYNLNDSCLLFADKFGDMKSVFAFRESGSDADFAFEDRADVGSTLYTENGTPVVLGEVINSGAEGNLHKVKNTGKQVAKVFKKGKLSPSKLKNLRKIAGINARMEISWALFPTELLYHRLNGLSPAGFTEGFAPTGKDLGDNPLFCGQLEDLSYESLCTRMSENIELCLKVVRQVCFLNTYGFLVSDYNMNNFASLGKDSKHIQMWDTDSFSFGTYFSGYCSGDKTTREYNITQKEDAIDFCSEAMYLFVFSILSLGDTPISEFTGRFKYANPNYAFLYRKKLFPDNLWQLFSDVFTQKKIPSVEILLQQLHTAWYALKDHPASDLTYLELLADVLPQRMQYAPPPPKPQPRPQPQIQPQPQYKPHPVPQQNAGGKIPVWVWALIAAGAIAVLFAFFMLFGGVILMALLGQNG